MTDAIDQAWPAPPRVDGLTGEQQAAVDLFHEGENLAIQAGAGTGKTTTLTAMARTTEAFGYYVAFNKQIVLDAGAKMPATVTAATAHSLAFGAVGKRYSHRLGSARMKSWDVANLLGLDPIAVPMPGGRTKRLAADYLGGVVMRALRTFAFSADVRPGPRHVPYIEGIDLPDDGGRTYANNMLVRDRLGSALERGWADLADVDGRLRFEHDHYLKLWQLSGARIPSDFILLDEAQDLSPVMLAIANAQDAQLVFVGDSQQQIYEWRGAIDALDSIDQATTTYLTQSFRFGPPIAEVANLVLGELDAGLRLVGSPAIDSRVGSDPTPRAILTRTNACAVSTVMERQAAGQTVHLVGGGVEVVSFAKAAAELIAGGRTFHPELACFDTWGEVQEYVARDVQGDELRLLVRLVDDYGVPAILKALEVMPTEAQASVIVSTAHKAKGREWDRVQLAGDYPIDNLEAGEWRLIYVAATRAREVLDIDQCVPLKDLRAAELKARAQLAMPS